MTLTFAEICKDPKQVDLRQETLEMKKKNKKKLLVCWDEGST